MLCSTGVRARPCFPTSTGCPLICRGPSGRVIAAGYGLVTPPGRSSIHSGASCLQARAASRRCSHDRAKETSRRKPAGCLLHQGAFALLLKDPPVDLARPVDQLILVEPQGHLFFGI